MNAAWSPDPGALRGRVAVVAGATRRCGRGIAAALDEAGATVVCTGRSSRTATVPAHRRAARHLQAQVNQRDRTITHGPHHHPVAAEPRTGFRRSDLAGPTLHSRVRMPPPKRGEGALTPDR